MLCGQSDASRERRLSIFGLCLNHGQTGHYAFPGLQTTGSSLEAANHVSRPAHAEVKEILLDNAQGTITVAPISVNIYQFPVGQGAQ